MTKALIIYHRYYDFENNRYEIGGIETYIRNLCLVLLTLGVEPHVIEPVKGRSGCAILPAGETVHSVDCSAGNIRPLVKKAYELGNTQKDVLVFATSTAIMQTKFKNTIGIQHGIYWDTTTIHGRALSGRLASTFARALQAKRILSSHSIVSRMVCVDLNYVNWMRSQCVDNRLPYAYIPNFADTSSILYKHTNDGKVRIVFARRLEPIRGCVLLMDVMPRILHEFPEVELTIAGGGSLESELRAVFCDDDRVSFTRYDAGEAVAFHGQFDIALVPSVASEGTSLSLLEAMSAGCAVIATDIGGMSNIILSGHNGLLVRPEAEDLFLAISSIVTDAETRSRLSCNARQTVKDSFSRERWAESWSNVISEFV